MRTCDFCNASTDGGAMVNYRVIATGLAPGFTPQKLIEFDACPECEHSVNEEWLRVIRERMEVGRKRRQEEAQP